MIKNSLLVFVCLVIGCCATIFTFLFFNPQLHLQPQLPVLFTQFSLEKAPTSSLTGSVISTSGNVLWQPRISIEAPIALTSLQKIQQGEGILTGGNGSASLQFPTLLAANLSQNTTVNIIQALPANMVFQQKEGTAAYEKIDTLTPVSIRAFDLLLTITSGKCTVSVDKDKSIVKVIVSQGFVTAAYTDTQNTTNIVTIQKGKTAKFDNDAKKITITP